MPTKPLQVGVTGGIGSGKSTVCRIFEIMGVPCYNADKRARWLMEHDAVIIEEVKALFGEDAYLDGKVNRDKLAAVSFKDRSVLERLNAIVHPRVGEDYAQWLAGQPSGLSIKEAALLFESGSYKALDKTITVSAPEALRIERVLARDPFRTRSEVEDIIAKQLSEEERTKLADYEVRNDEIHSLIDQVLGLYQELTKES